MSRGLSRGRSCCHPSAPLRPAMGTELLSPLPLGTSSAPLRPARTRAMGTELLSPLPPPGCRGDGVVVTPPAMGTELLSPFRLPAPRSPFCLELPLRHAMETQVLSQFLASPYVIHKYNLPPSVMSRQRCHITFGYHQGR